MSAAEAAVAAAAALVNAMLAEAQGTPAGAEIVSKAQRLLAAGAHCELNIQFTGDAVGLGLGVRLDNGHLLQIDSKRMVRRPHGTC